jgi:hypothetical protein
MFVRSKTLVIAPLALLAVASMLAACGSDTSSSPAATGASTTVAPPFTAPPPASTAPTTTTASTPSTTGDGGGSAQAGAPAFGSYTVTSPATCTNGNANVTMAYTTRNAVSIAIKIGNGAFASTAGYGPNETGVIAAIPCTGAGTSSIQLKACTENNTCTTSETKTVKIRAAASGTPTTAPPAPSTTHSTGGSGGSAQAGAPVFDSFTVTSPATCTNGNANVTMAYETRNAVSIAIKIGNGAFASTAGYGPNETAAVASVPCSGAGTTTIELKACTENNTCTTSGTKSVEIDA